jgi:ligand-binding sensor domain-containing protein
MKKLGQQIFTSPPISPSPYYGEGDRGRGLQKLNLYRSLKLFFQSKAIVLKTERTLFPLVKRGLFLLFCILTLYSSVSSTGMYREGDWVSWSVFRYVTSIAMDFDHVYFGTTGGVIRYDRFEKKWETPFTESDGLPDNWIRNIAYAPERNEIWVDTYAGPASYQPVFREWSREFNFPANLAKSDTSDLNLPNFFMDYGFNFLPNGYIMDFDLNQYKITDYLKGDFDDLWIATWGLGAGLASLRSLQLSMLRFGLYDKDVKAILIDGDDMWFGGSGLFYPSQGITRYNRKSETWDYFSTSSTYFLVSNQVNACESDAKFVWFGTEDGLARFNKKDKSWKSYNTFKGLPDNEVTVLNEDHGILWIGTRLGLAFCDVRKDSIRKVDDPLLKGLYIYSILSDSDFVWVGTEQGVYSLDKDKKTWYRFYTPDNLLFGQVRSIAKYSSPDSLPLGSSDSSGKKTYSGKDEIWFGTDMGVLGYNPVTNERMVYQSKINFSEVYVIKLVCDKRYVWVATKNGVLRLNKELQVWTKYTTLDGLLDNSVQDLILDGDYIWFGTPQGVTRFFWNNPRLRD